MSDLILWHLIYYIWDFVLFLCNFPPQEGHQSAEQLKQQFLQSKQQKQQSAMIAQQGGMANGAMMAQQGGMANGGMVAQQGGMANGHLQQSMYLHMLLQLQTMQYTPSRWIKPSAWNSNFNPYSTWNSNLSLVFNLEFQFEWG